MFTGIVEEIGTIIKISSGINSRRLGIEGKKIFDDLKEGDSVAVNGICLTVAALHQGYFEADVMGETLERSNLGKLQKTGRVNLERAMSANGRFGGHMVSGHIDGTGVIKEIRKDDQAIWYTIQTSDKIIKYVIEKGSIAIDGISLTVAKVGEDFFSVSIIPHTQKNTILYTKKAGDTVNLENDMVGKYIDKLLGLSKVENEKPTNKISLEFLKEHGY